MRHGERADFVRAKNSDSEDDDSPKVNALPYNSNIAHDPPLTAKGIKQAAHAGTYLKDRMKVIEQEYGIKFDEVHIETSPFLRCLQTSSRVAQVLSVPNVNVNYLMCEDETMMTHSEDNAIDKLDFSVNDRAILQSEALAGVEMCDNKAYYD